MDHSKDAAEAIDLTTQEGVFAFVEFTLESVRNEFERNGEVSTQFVLLAPMDHGIMIYSVMAPGIDGRSLSRIVREKVSETRAIGVVLVYEAWVSNTKEYADFSKAPGVREMVSAKLEHESYGTHRWTAEITRTDGVKLGPFSKQDTVTKGRISDFIRPAANGGASN